MDAFLHAWPHLLALNGEPQALPPSRGDLVRFVERHSKAPRPPLHCQRVPGDQARGVPPTCLISLHPFPVAEDAPQAPQP